MQWTQRWRPDTCECDIIEILDGTPDDAKIIGCEKVNKKCDAHKDLSDQDILHTVYKDLKTGKIGENLMKNQVHGALLGLAGIDFGLHNEKKNSDGNHTHNELKDGIEYVWSFNGSGKERKLNVEVKGYNLPQEYKKKLKELCGGKFGVSRVNIL